jgi:hypothetical protein
MVDKVKTDAEGGEPLDKVLSKLDSLGKRMDALEVGSGSKNPLKADKGRKDDDDDDDDDDKKKDDEEEEGEDKKPAFLEKKDDDDDDGEEEEGKKPPPMAADKKKDARKDQLPPPAAEEKGKIPPVSDKKDAKKDAKKSDNDEEEEEKKDDDDDDDDDRRDDKSKKADSVSALKRQMEEQRREIARLSSMMKPRSDEEHAAFADAQARADEVFAGFGGRAPRPLEGESLLSYRKRLATHLKKHSEHWKGVKFSKLPEEAFNIAERQVYADAITAAASPTDLGEGELRAVRKHNPDTNQNITVFYGKDSFVKGFGRPARRVAVFNTRPSA